MKSKQTPWTHTGKTSEEITTTFGASGSHFKYTVTVPAGTVCRKLDGGSDPWVVGDLSFIEDKNGILYSDADIYGIRIPEEKIIEIKPVQ
ncbi:hypothetical protein [Cupriavidus sp. TMH.W2]|uniref:hypothetical protein n=1 Tax=Cupriavidus sp. TMH.W2 TaxID=3434465 RepID=UPI003D77F62C